MPKLLALKLANGINDTSNYKIGRTYCIDRQNQKFMPFELLIATGLVTSHGDIHRRQRIVYDYLTYINL